MIGLITRHGPHQAAWKSTTTGASDSRTSAVKRASVGSKGGMPSTLGAEKPLSQWDSLCPRSAGGDAAGRGRRVLALRGGDQLAHGGLVARAQERDRIGVAVDDPLEEGLAVLVGRQRALRPPARLVQQHLEPRVRL